MLIPIKCFIDKYKDGFFKNFVFSLKNIIEKDNFFSLDLESYQDKSLHQTLLDRDLDFIKEISKFYMGGIISEEDFQSSIENCFFVGLAAMHFTLKSNKQDDKILLLNVEKFLQEFLKEGINNFNEKICEYINLNKNPFLKQSVNYYINKYSMTFGSEAFELATNEFFDDLTGAASYIASLVIAFNFGCAIYSTINKKI